ncbi:hypothetical protein SBV1_2670021 [Verrucomicrobia bacterium]|nr:hypothetical protein SBV1_2670021 [Verrucomicrobiota bacterium]
MPKLVPISHRELARKLRSAGFVEIRTSRHHVYYSSERDLTIPIPMHPGDVPKGTLRSIIRQWALTWKHSTPCDLRPSARQLTASVRHNMGRPVSIPFGSIKEAEN